jgi:enoyl-CoA hydratase/carnithine racemase
MSDVSRVEAHRDGAVLVITLNGPKSRNSIGPDVYLAVRNAVVDAGRDGDIRAIVLTGAGGFFSSGGNISALKESAKGPLSAATSNTDRLNAMIRAIVECPTPVVAAVEGGAAGAGIAVALSCDMIVAANDAKFTATYTKVGLSPDGGLTYFLRSALPRQLVNELCMLGRPVTAERLALFGIVNELTEPGQAQDAGLALAHTIAAGPAGAIGSIKQLVNAAEQNDLATHLWQEADRINQARYGDEAAEGLQAFLEKRKPDFSKL